MTAISVIIPAYNEEKTLEACLASVFANQFFSLECILVDDGSTDSTLELCKRLAARYPSVKVFTKPNSGLADTRNVGLEHATGTFITFVDADDTLPPNALSLMYNAALETGSDIIIGNQLRKDTLGKLSQPSHYKRWIQPRYNVSLADEPEALLSVSAWGKLYKSSFLKENTILFLPGQRWGEDLPFLYHALTRTDDFSCITNVVYYYHSRKRHEQNLTNQATLPHIAATKQLFTFCREVFRDCDTPLYKKIREGRIKHSLAYHSFRNVIRNNDPANFIELQTIVKSALDQVDPSAVTSDIRLNTVLEEIASAKNYRLLRARFLIRDCAQKTLRLIQSIRVRVVAHGKRRIAPIIALAHPSTLSWFIKVGIAYVTIKLKIPPTKHIWLIGEREGKSLNDNGYALFSYLLENQTDIYPILVIHPSLLPKLPRRFASHTVTQGSLKHLIYCLTAEVSAYTHTLREIVCHPLYQGLPPYVPVSGLNVFLGHGATALHNVPYYSHDKMKTRREEPDLFIASSAKERETIINYLGHPPERVVITGMPRLDRLHKSIERSAPTEARILLIPTWRQSMERQSSLEFSHSRFFKSVRAFLQSPQLIQFLTENNLQVHWIVHHQFKKHFDTLQTLKSRWISIERMVDADFSHRLTTSLLLITDYSSISFDMASINRPVIYFQFDQEDFLSARDGTSLHYDRDLPGPVLHTAEEVVRELEEAAMRGFTQKEMHQERTKTFFTHADSNNSRRVYEAIKARLAESVR